MQYIVPAFVALAIGANAAPQWNYPEGFGGPHPHATAPGPGPTGLVPTGTGLVPLPTAPASHGYDDDEEGDESSTSTSSATKPTASGNSTADSSASSYSATITAAAAVARAVSGGSLPASSGTSVLDAVQTIAAGESFDGGMVAFDRGVDCSGQAEGGDSDAVFYLENGASLSNVIIGPNQAEGVHCYGSCTLTNVWWSDVCEDAFTIKEQDASETTTITGGGAYGADDKVLQHNGGGTLSVSGFTVETFGKLYRSCGNCDEMYERHVIFDDISATDGSALAGINSNYGDTATFTNIATSDVGDICVEYEGNDTGDEPEEIASGPSDYCIYSTSDITES